MKKTTWSITDIEKDIDRLTDMAGPMTAFVLPGVHPVQPLPTSPERCVDGRSDRWSYSVMEKLLTLMLWNI